MRTRREDGFTLIEVLVALAVIAIGLSALMSAISGTASASGYLRLKAQAQWIALNRLIEVRLNMQKFATSTDTGELDYAGQHWHYDTRYFDTGIPTMQRVVVRVWAGKADSKSNPLGEYTGFVGTALASAGTSNAVDWTAGSTATPLFGAAPGNGTTSPAPLPIPGMSRGIGGSQQQGGLGLDSSSGDNLGGDGFGDSLGTNNNGNSVGSSSGGDSSSSGGLQNDSSGGSP
jgi:general secretion pathway protein I